MSNFLIFVALNILSFSAKTILAIKERNFNYSWERYALDALDATGASATNDNNKLHVKSQGKFADLVFLDDEETIQKLKCVQWKLILIGYNQTSVGENWSKGQIILGGSRWDCPVNPFGFGQGVIIGRISHMTRPYLGRTDVFLEKVRHLDIFKEATISIEFSQETNLTKKEKKFKNQESEFLDFNSRKKDEICSKVSFIKGKWNFSNPQNQAFTTNRNPKNETELKIIHCFKKSIISVKTKLMINQSKTGEIGVEIAENQVRLDFSSHVSTSLDIIGQLSINDSLLLSEQPQQQLLSVPVMEAKQGLPTIIMTVLVRFDSRMKATIQASPGNSQVIVGALATADVIAAKEADDEDNNLNLEASENWTLESFGQKVLDVDQRLEANLEFIDGFHFETQLSVLMDHLYPVYKIPYGFSLSPSLMVNSPASKTLKSVDIFSSLQTIADKNSYTDYESTTLGQKMLYSQIQIACDLSLDVPDPKFSMEQLCGKMTAKITQNHRKFNELYQLHGDRLLFAAENSSSHMCGPLKKETNKNGDEVICKHRMVTPTMALRLSKLTEMAHYTWSNRKLVVLEGWNEVKSDEYGESSLYYEGRAVRLGISNALGRGDPKSGPIFTLDESGTQLRILARLANCSGFPYVRPESSHNYVEVAVEPDVKPGEDQKENLTTLQEELFESNMKEETVNSHQCDSILESFFPEGSQFPADRSPEEVCGPTDNPINLHDVKQYSMLYEYPFDGIRFSPESEARSSWCGSPLRRCLSDCPFTSGHGTLWHQCSSRLMTPRLAIRLRKLEKLANDFLKREEAVLNKPVIKVEIGYKGSIENEKFFSNISNLYTEGRALRLSVKVTQNFDLEQLSLLSICAGFDYVRYSGVDFIEVFVKKQSGLLPTLVTFPSDVDLLAVEPPPEDSETYASPPDLISGEIPLMDGSDHSIALSPNFHIKDFVYPGYRYFRIDPLLVGCLDEARDASPLDFYVIPGSAYRTTTAGYGSPAKETMRFQTGQAVEVATEKPEDLVTLAKLIVRICAMKFATEERALGVGMQSDRLYIDIHNQDGEGFLKIWNYDMEPTLFKPLEDYIAAARTGSSFIQPVAFGNCKETGLGPDLFYLTLEENDDLCQSSSENQFCSETEKRREEESENFMNRLISAAGTGAIDRSDIVAYARQCFVTKCGGCAGFGSVWTEKFLSCAKLVEEFVKKASRPFPELKNKVAFYSSSSSYSKVHHLACDGESLCIDEIPLYALLGPLLESKYRPGGSLTVEELLFDGQSNANPMVEIVEQELAMQAIGEVSVFIQSDEDLSILRNVIKVLLIFNPKVTHVRFFLTDDVEKMSFSTSLNSKVTLWSRNACSDWTRLVLTPFTIENIPTAKQKRSIEGSRMRNERKILARNWEIQWLESL